MRKIFVVYKVTCLKNSKVKYGVIYYYSYSIVNPLQNTSTEKELLKKIGKKSPNSKLFKIEWLYQNIEEQECYRFLELAHNITKENTSKVLQQ